MWRIITAAVVLLAGCSQSGGGAPEMAEGTTAQAVTTEAEKETTTTAAPEATTAPAEIPTVKEGTGRAKTDPFDLGGGRYVVDYEFPGDCYYSGALRSTSGDSVSDDVGSGTGISGQTNIYGLEPGSYYIDLITGPSPGCPWKVTLTPA